jgi:hypothetical protein
LKIRLKTDTTAETTDLTDADEQRYQRLVSTELSPEQIKQIVNPPAIHPQQKAVLAVHWHPEFIPIDLILQRVATMYPNREDELIIPTQHNCLLSLDGFAGVEVDCYSQQFNRKVQLLLHFREEAIAGDRAAILKDMLAYTFSYRSRQLFEFIDTIIDDRFHHRLEFPAKKTGIDDGLLRLVRYHAGKLKRLIERHEAKTRPEMLRNKLVRNYFAALKGEVAADQIERAQIFLKEVKAIVKAHFPLAYFYRTAEIIEEARTLGAGIVIPHPEQFWPILLADYDVDGYEVWNPQSREYTDFLINVVHRQNKSGRSGKRPLLVFMGDDTHFGEKVLEVKEQNPEKVQRELGLHPAWEDRDIRKSLILAGAGRRRVISEYRDRLMAN